MAVVCGERWYGEMAGEMVWLKCVGTVELEPLMMKCYLLRWNTQ